MIPPRTLPTCQEKPKPTSVPSLLEICISTATQYADAIEDIGDIPGNIVQRLMKFATPQKLIKLEETSVGQVDTDSLWHELCVKNKFVSHSDPVSKDTNWKQIYFDNERELKEKTRNFGERLRVLYKDHTEAKQARQTKVIHRPHRPISRNPSMPAKGCGNLMMSIKKDFVKKNRGKWN
eukprot:TRINITY_DN13594_c0_g1_i1.p1 TRINITY_DN13594_c0_g1~~TRINITY_DN13594_c0_g1_i1.p1  ORF type:complete len:179 (-),score=32.57 TRINITY_DN13594_c0_g1_i1:198-734(-)